jgi:hypothetical protein
MGRRPHTAAYSVGGVGDLQTELNTMSKQGRWKEMGTLVTDDMLNQFAVVGEPASIVPETKRRYGAIVDRTSASFDFVDAEKRKAMIAALRAA